jgi:hypothetical protein
VDINSELIRELGYRIRVGRADQKTSEQIAEDVLLWLAKKPNILEKRIFDCLGEPDYKLARMSHASEPWHYWSRESIASACRTYLHQTSETEIKALAERLWRVHPKEIQELGITRQKFYEQEIARFVSGS